MPVTRSGKRRQSEQSSGADEQQHDKTDESPSTTPKRARRTTRNDAAKEQSSESIDQQTPNKSTRTRKTMNSSETSGSVTASADHDHDIPNSATVDTNVSPKSRQSSRTTARSSKNESKSSATLEDKQHDSIAEKKPKLDTDEHRQDTTTDDIKPKSSTTDREQSKSDETSGNMAESKSANGSKIPQSKDLARPSIHAAVLTKTNRIATSRDTQPDDLDDDQPVWSLKRAQQEKPSRQCPYLDTIDRCVLDFDFEKLCSVSLSHLNVYACLVCGKYYQGRGTSTHAYMHSLDTGHHIYLNLQTLKFYCLPDNYEVIDPSLEDIKYVLMPTYTREQIRNMDKITKMVRAFDGTTYYPGVIGLNNIKANDYCNAVLHALAHVGPLRDYFLCEDNYASIKRPPGDKLALLPRRFGELVRKLWNPRAFKAHVSPHEMLQAAVLCSEKRFQITKQSDAADFMNWLLNTLHVALNGTTKTSSSIIYKIFRGRMRQYTRKVLPVDASEEARATLLETEEFKETVKELPFLYLTLDLPAAPLYRDEQMQNIIPQIPLSALFAKYDGIVEKEYKTYNENFMKRFELLRLPEHLIISFKRFNKNQWFIEKNPTIVNFPISNVDLYDCLAEDARLMHKYTTYDLAANIVHDGRPDAGSYRIQLAHRGTGKWFEMEDLHVKEILPQMITLAECYIQIWKLNTTKTRDERIGETDESSNSNTILTHPTNEVIKGNDEGMDTN